MVKRETAVNLVSDIGGTNVRFALVPANTTTPHEEQTLRCKDFSGPVEAARHYLSRVSNPDVHIAAFDVATAVTGDQVTLTNGPWSFSIEQTRQALNLDRLSVINDFTALAYAVPLLDAGEKRQVGGGSPLADAAIGVLGAGTGLGVSGLLPYRGSWMAIEGEGGHVAFSPATEREDAILRIFRRRFGSHISVERLLSGMGLTNIYEALCELDGVQLMRPEPEEITGQARHDAESRSRETVQIFCAALGTAAGNLALTLGARGGVYVGGGIVPKLGNCFEQSEFRRRFEDKGRFSDFVSKIPTYVILAETPALRGLSAFLQNQQ